MNDNQTFLSSEEFFFLENLTIDSVGILKKTFVTTSNNEKVQLGDNWRCALKNNTYGREEIKNILPEAYLNCVMQLWGDKPTVPDVEEGEVYNG